MLSLTSPPRNGFVDTDRRPMELLDRWKMAETEDDMALLGNGCWHGQ